MSRCHLAVILVESHLTPKGPRQKVICSLGNLSPRPKQQWLELARKLENALTGQQDLFAFASPDPELETLVAKVKAGPRRRRAQRALALRAGLPSADLDREDAGQPGRPHVLGDGARDAQDAPGFFNSPFSKARKLGQVSLLRLTFPTVRVVMMDRGVQGLKNRPAGDGWAAGVLAPGIEARDLRAFVDALKVQS